MLSAMAAATSLRAEASGGRRAAEKDAKDAAEAAAFPHGASDHALARRAAAGDIAAFEEIYKNRARREHARDSADGDRGTNGVAPGAEPEARTPVVEQIALSDALARLPEGYRTVFVLHDIEGYEHEEIARLLGCAPGTSKSQLHKARERLRELLNARSHKSLLAKTR